MSKFLSGLILSLPYNLLVIFQEGSDKVSFYC